MARRPQHTSRWPERLDWIIVALLVALYFLASTALVLTLGHR